MKRPRQSAVRQNAGPLALFSFVVNVTASFFCQFSRHISTWEKELNRRRQTLKPLENQGFFRLSLLYRNGIPMLRYSLHTEPILLLFLKGLVIPEYLRRPIFIRTLSAKWITKRQICSTPSLHQLKKYQRANIHINNTYYSKNFTMIRKQIDIGFAFLFYVSDRKNLMVV